MNNAMAILRNIQEEWINFKEFVAYVIPESYVQASLLGLRLNLKVVNGPADFVGVAVLDHNIRNRCAYFIRPATQNQTSEYLSLFPRSLAVVFRNKYNNWMGVSGRQTAPIYGVDEFIQEFDTVIVYRIGDTWVYGSQSIAPTRISSGLRAALENKDPNPKISLSTPDHRIAYTEKVGSVARPVNTIASAVSFMGGNLIDIIDRGDGTSFVTYSVANTTFTSLVNNENMQVILSGICLDGRDRDFDLTTLIPVMQKGIANNRVHRTAIGDEND